MKLEMSIEFIFNTKNLTHFEFPEIILTNLKQEISFIILRRQPLVQCSGRCFIEEKNTWLKICIKAMFSLVILFILFLRKDCNVDPFNIEEYN